MESNTTYTSETHTETPKKTSASPAVVALAAIGFVALIIVGILLAIYSSQYVPQAVSKLTPSVPVTTFPSPAQFAANSSTTIPFAGESTTSDAFPASTQVSTLPGIADSAIPSAQSNSQLAAASAAPTHPALYGLPNLTTTIIATGYLAAGTTNSFVPAQVVPAGARAAVEFSIANTGTNVTGPWNFAASIPTQNTYLFTSATEQSMGPGDHVVFTLGFDQADLGSNEPISIVADPNNTVQESTKTDNTATAAITVLPPQGQGAPSSPYDQYGDSLGD